MTRTKINVGGAPFEYALADKFARVYGGVNGEQFLFSVDCPVGDTQDELTVKEFILIYLCGKRAGHADGVADVQAELRRLAGLPSGVGNGA